MDQMEQFEWMADRVGRCNGTNTSMTVDRTDGTYGLNGTYKMDGKMDYMGLHSGE